MKIRDEIADLSAALGSMAADLRAHQDKLLTYGQALESIMEELSRRNQEITLFSKMNDFLQTSTTEAEAYSIISETVAQLFPADSGAVFVLNAPRDMLEAATVWGALPPPNLIFPPSECWALRRGQVHVSSGDERKCPHTAGHGHTQLCLPLLSQGETLGILHLLDGEAGDDKADAPRMVEKSKLAKILADSIGLGIANLKLRETTRNLSIRDPLTGLFNRRYMEEVLAQEQHRARRNNAQLAVIMIDIDHFKKFNDDFGHDGGDAVLRSLGEFLKKQVRGSDIACRFGGEEFLLILSPSSADGARLRAEKVREEAALLSVNHASKDLGAITLSLGVAMLPGSGADGPAAIKAADLALYEAKRGGRNCVVMASSDTAQPVQRPAPVG